MIDGIKIADALDKARTKIEGSLTYEGKKNLLASLEADSNWVGK